MSSEATNFCKGAWEGGFFQAMGSDFCGLTLILHLGDPGFLDMGDGIEDGEFPHDRESLSSDKIAVSSAKFKDG